MAIKTSIVMVFMVCLAGVHCHTYYLGSCPRVDPVNDFDMSKVRPKYNYFVRSKNTSLTLKMVWSIWRSFSDAGTSSKSSPLLPLVGRMTLFATRLMIRWKLSSHATMSLWIRLGLTTTIATQGLWYVPHKKVSLPYCYDFILFLFPVGRPRLEPARLYACTFSNE